MGKITKIFDDQYTADRKVIFIDGNYCTKVKNRTFMSMNVKVGDEISCKDMKELESFHWKKTYGEEAWEKEIVRLNIVKDFIHKIRDDLKIKETGFGAGTTEFIAEHPEESGSPDLTIYKNSIPLLYVEVTGTEYKKGNDYWVRPDKIKYIQKHIEQNIWIVLYYNDIEQFVFIQPDMKKEYNFEEIKIKDSIEHYVIFNDSSVEVKSMNTFVEDIKAL